MNYFEKTITVNGFSVPLIGYLPDNPTRKSGYIGCRPAVIVLPGGAYSDLAAHEGEPIALRLAGEGICAFVLKYSVRPSGAVFPQALAETLTAIRYVRDRAEEFGIDPQNISTLGFSAGGHLCASSGVLWNHPCLSGMIGDDRENYRPDKIVPCYPVISNDPSFSHQGSFVNLFGKPFAEFTEEEREISSLEKQVKPDSSPAFLWTTFEDSAVPPTNALVFAEAMVRCHVPCEMHMYPHGPHGIGLANHQGTEQKYGNAYEAADWISQAVRFLYDERIR